MGNALKTISENHFSGVANGNSCTWFLLANFCGSASILFWYKTSSFIFYRSYCWRRCKTSKLIESSLSVCASLSYFCLPLCLSLCVCCPSLPLSNLPVCSVICLTKTLRAWQYFLFFFCTLLLLFTHYSLIFSHLTSSLSVFFFCFCLFLDWAVIAYLGRNKSQVNGVCVCVCSHAKKSSWTLVSALYTDLCVTLCVCVYDKCR